MPSPFPGMDPYLESPEIWPDVHHAVIAEVSMKQILFFALKEDFLPLLELVESKGALRYVRMGNFPIEGFDERATSFKSGIEIPNLGWATADSSMACDSYLVCEQLTPISLRAVSDRVCIDQLENANSVTFTPAGMLNENVLLHGRIATVSESQVSQALMKRFHAAVSKSFPKVRTFHVGPNALALLDDGKRLTISAHAPREFDLARLSTKPSAN